MVFEFWIFMQELYRKFKSLTVELVHHVTNVQVVYPSRVGSNLQFKFLFSDRTINDEPKIIKDLLETDFKV